MATTPTCPAMDHYREGEQCFENFAGVGDKIYIGVKSDLTTPMALTDNTYSAPTFKADSGLYEFDCKEDSNQIEGESLGPKKGNKITATLVLDVVNKMMSKNARAMNNLDIFIIIPDGDEYQILYDPKRKITRDAGAIKTSTGQKAEDDRITTATFSISPVKYPNLYVTITNIDALVKGYVAPTGG